MKILPFVFLFISFLTARQNGSKFLLDLHVEAACKHCCRNWEQVLLLPFYLDQLLFQWTNLSVTKCVQSTALVQALSYRAPWGNQTDMVPRKHHMMVGDTDKTHLFKPWHILIEMITGQLSIGQSGNTPQEKVTIKMSPKSEEWARRRMDDGVLGREAKAGISLVHQRADRVSTAERRKEGRRGT